MARASVVSCGTCGLVQAVDRLPPGGAAECIRCGSFLAAGASTGRLEVVAALSLAALVLYVPANIYPILRMRLHGSYSENTVWDPWAMLDVFLLAVLVALVKLSTWANVVPGPGLVAFTAVVVLTMLASAAFDPKLLWERR